MLDTQGFEVFEGVFDEEEVNSLKAYFDTTVAGNNKGVFAIRNLFGNHPHLLPLVFTERFLEVKNRIAPQYSLIKAVYFDKPEESNWFVAWHQDITISVKDKEVTEGFINWVPKEHGYSVQPPVEYLENIITLRIHLDDTSESNGALRVLPQSHTKGVIRITQTSTEGAITCNVNSGEVMAMKPLLIHSSKRISDGSRRRVIHLEFSNKNLPEGLQWAEFISEYKQQ